MLPYIRGRSNVGDFLFGTPYWWGACKSSPRFSLSLAYRWPVDASSMISSSQRRSFDLNESAPNRASHRFSGRQQSGLITGQ